MADNIFVRVQRVVSGGVDTAVGAAERLSGPALMRHALRDADRVIRETQDSIDAAHVRALAARRRAEAAAQRLAEMQGQARFALDKGREDLAAAVLSRQLDFEKEIDRLKQEQDAAETEAKRLETCLVDLKLRRAQMEKELAAFQAPCGSDGDAALTADLRAEQKVARAEERFERAMGLSGVPGAGLADAAAAAKLAEVAALQREAEVAQRLAALRQAAGEPEQPEKAKRKSRR
jgi:phage shock protein A